jgi:hypothetical protein
VVGAALAQSGRHVHLQFTKPRSALDDRQFFSQFPARLRRFRQHQHADALRPRPYYTGYVRDDARLTPRLTLNAGLRYDLELPPYEQYDRASTFALDAPNPAAGNRPGALVFLGSGPGRTGSRTFEDTHYVALNPRLGLAYQLRHATVLRLGYGVSHSSNQLLNDHMGFSTTQNFDTLDNGNTPAFLLDDGMPTNWPRPPFLNPAFGNNNNVSAVIRDDSARMPLTQNWRLDIQRELPGGTVLELAYVGTRATTRSLRCETSIRWTRAILRSALLGRDITSAAARGEHPDPLPRIQRNCPAGSAPVSAGAHESPHARTSWEPRPTIRSGEAARSGLLPDFSIDVLRFRN